MTTVTVSVSASWRLSRVEFHTPYVGQQLIQGYGEVLLEEPVEASPGSQILKTPKAGEGETKVYGAMHTGRVLRVLPDVMDETVDLDGTTVSLSTVMDAMKLFFEKWRAEDVENPPETPPATLSIPMAADQNSGADWNADTGG